VIYAVLGLFYGLAFGATVYGIALDVATARQQERRARVQRPVMSLAVMRIVGKGWRR
jgi:hypothetical protein